MQGIDLLSEEWDVRSSRSTSAGSTQSWSLPGFSNATETDLSSDSVCSFPQTMNHAFFRLHRRSAAVNKIKAKVPNLYESKGVYNCLEQEIWPNRKVTTYQRCFGAKARVRPQRGSFGPKGAELPSRKAEILATPGALPGAPGASSQIGERYRCSPLGAPGIATNGARMRPCS